MVYNPQIIKDHPTRTMFEKNVRDRINQTQSTLNQLKAKMTEMEKNSSIAKQDVQEATDSIIQQLKTRKVEMTQQIDLLTQPQIVSLHERIHSTCVALGSLQSTLNNIDSFDYSNQVFRLLEPSVSCSETSVQSEIKVELPTENIMEMVGKWGSVQLKPAAEQIPELCVEQPVINNMPSSSSSLKSVPSAMQSTQCKKSVDCTQKRFESSKENQWTDPKDFQIEKWLRSMNIHQQSPTDSDDFEMLEPIKLLSEFNKTPSCVEMESNNVEKAPCDGEDGSSIVCVESDDLSFGVIGVSDENDDEIGKWLHKPKKQRRNSVSSADKISSEIMQTYLCKKSKIPTKLHLDFPCLRLDPNTWIKRKTTDKSTKKTNVHHTKGDVQLCLQMSQSDIIPPMYALPYPFWLKKY